VRLTRQVQTSSGIDLVYRQIYFGRGYFSCCLNRRLICNFLSGYLMLLRTETSVLDGQNFVRAEPRDGKEKGSEESGIERGAIN
jgi:hypothetical protein